jgi:hypothetical protein
MNFPRAQRFFPASGAGQLPPGAGFCGIKALIPFSVFGFQFSVNLISEIIVLCAEFVAFA